MSESFEVRAPMKALVVDIRARVGQKVAAGETLVILEAMKMEHIVTADRSGVVTGVLVAADGMVEPGEALVRLEAANVESGSAVEGTDAVDRIRPDLEELNTRLAFGRDENRPDAVAKRRKTGQRTARENVADLVDDGTWVEYGALVIAAQRQRRSKEDLIARTPADGMVAGIGRINGDLFRDTETRAVVTSYDYTVLAGTQGTMNHLKKDRMFEIAEKQGFPVVLFSEGGGGRPGDTDYAVVAGLDCRAFQYFAELSGKVPLVGVNSGRCFAGNAALLGCCDVVIATKASNIGMGGPAMIEGGGLGVFAPEQIGPSESQYRNGVIDMLVEDDPEAVAAAKKYLSYFQGELSDWSCEDQRLLRSAVPENRLRVYDVRRVVETLMDEGSVLELRGGFGIGMITSLARIEGRPVGVIANNPKHLGGAIDGEAADKASDFMALCSTFDIPVVFLCDTPGFMVGPEAEESGLVKRAARLFTTGARLKVPFCTVVLRKGYGLGAQSMAGGSFKAPVFTISWPTGEFGGMGLEGAVKLGFRKELESIEDPEARAKMFEQMVALAYERGKAINMAEHFEIDAVIDPIDTRR
ncbi:MAG: carboxyl transferase domain-containing protein, partial [Polyangiales bacterium]